MYALFIAAAIGQTGAAQVPFTSAYTVSNLRRLAITPVLDGKLESEEWDEFVAAPDFTGYMQWEPRTIHVAASLPVGKDLVVSLDCKGDGWLVGKDNVEVRVSWIDGKPDVKSRILDATNNGGPTWVEESAFATSSKYAIAAGSDPNQWIVEMSIQDPGFRYFPADAGPSIGIRMDAIESSQKSFQPFWPRLTTNVVLAHDQSTNIAPPLTWRPIFRTGQSVIPGDKTKIGLEFRGSDDSGVKRLEMRSEGFAKESALVTALPFPPFDTKGRSWVDYESLISPGAMKGWRVLRATLNPNEEKSSIIRTSYEIANLLTIDLTDFKIQTKKDGTKTLYVAMFARANGQKVNGDFSIKVPQGWSVVRGDNTDFGIGSSRGGARRSFELLYPRDATGTFPITFQAKIGLGQMESTHWVYIPKN